jgi:hypothetical protein
LAGWHPKVCSGLGADIVTECAKLFANVKQKTQWARLASLGPSQCMESKELISGITFAFRYFSRLRREQFKRCAAFPILQCATFCSIVWLITDCLRVLNVDGDVTLIV